MAKNRKTLITLLWAVLIAFTIVGAAAVGCDDDDDDDDDNDAPDDDDMADDDDDMADDDDDMADDDDVADDDDDVADDDDDDDTGPPTGNKVGDTLANFTLNNAQGGTTTLYDYKGKVVMLDCAAMW